MSMIYDDRHYNPPPRAPAWSEPCPVCQVEVGPDTVLDHMRGHSTEELMVVHEWLKEREQRLSS